MKIGYVLDDRIDSADGVQQLVKRLGGWMETHGHEVHYICGDSPTATEKHVHNVSRTVRVRFNKNHMGIPLPAHRRRVRQLLAQEHFDVLHVQAPYSPLLAGRVIAAADPSTAVVGTFHILPYGWLSRVGTRLLGWVVRRTNARFDAFFSTSEPTRVFAASHFGVKSVVSPNIVDVSSYKKGVPLPEVKDKKNIVFLGRLMTRKGAPYLLNAFGVMAGRDPEFARGVRLIFCGKGPEMATLQAEAAKITAATGAEIRFEGFIDEADKPHYLASADVAVFPSTGGESFGIVLIEAMAARAGVVIAGNNPGYASVFSTLPEALFDPKDQEAFCALLAQALFDPAFKQRLHRAQQALVPSFDVAVVAPRVEKVYRTALAKRRHKGNTT